MIVSPSMIRHAQGTAFEGWTSIIKGRYVFICEQNRRFIQNVAIFAHFAGIESDEFAEFAAKSAASSPKRAVVRRIAIVAIAATKGRVRIDRLAEKADRRVQRTRKLLQRALIDLINERSYDDITVQDIVDRANVGRTTFYLHFNGKDELFITCHEALVADFYFWPLTREEILSPEPPPGMVAAYRHLQEVRVLLNPIFQGKDSAIILRRMREWGAKQIEISLRDAFAEADSAIPFSLLATYLAGAQITLIQWWMDKRTPYPADDLARMMHRLQRAAICEAVGVE